jgi:putative oxidoreductase
MDIVLLIGRIIFGGFFFMMGMMHFKNLKDMTEYARSKGTPSPAMAVMGSGLLMFLGGLGVMLGVYPDISLILIGIFLFFVTPKMHQFWKETDPQRKMNEMINFLKNMALLGATIALYTFSSGWPLSV